MPQPRKPSNVLQAAGAFAKNPQRGKARSSEPKKVGKPLGNAHSSLPPEMKKIWTELKKKVPAGVAFQADEPAFEVGVRLLWLIRFSDPEKMPITAVAQFRQWAAQFGMTPADRSRVSVASEKTKEGWDEF